MPSEARTTLARALHIHEALLANRFPTRSKLAEDLEVSVKTIQRDIDYLRDQLGLPIEYSSHSQGYTYTETVSAFPTILATEGEILALFVARKALAAYSGTPFEKPLRSAFEKLSRTMTRMAEVDPETLTQVLSFHTSNSTTTDIAVFETVAKALRDRREITFTYHKLQALAPEIRKAQPWHLACIDNQWYLFAWDLQRKDMRTFVLSRMVSIDGIGDTFKPPANFSLTEHLINSFGVFKGQGNFAIRIEFDSFAARLVSERQWHASQKIRELPGERIELSLQLGSLEEIERWVLSWGNHARVIAPPELQQRIQNHLEQMQSQYSTSAPRWARELLQSQTLNESPAETLLQLAFRIDQPDHPDQLHFRFREPSRRN